MNSSNLDREIARLILLEKTEFLSPILTRLRKIFDTIRPKHFQKVFENVDIIKNKQKSIHALKRIVCKKFKKTNCDR